MPYGCDITIVIHLGYPFVGGAVVSICKLAVIKLELSGFSHLDIILIHNSAIGLFRPCLIVGEYKSIFVNVCNVKSLC